MDVMNELYKIVLDRKENPQEGSYTSYLYKEGLDKILKKIGEECSETIIAAKNNDNKELTMEICDLFYHVIVLMGQSNLDIKDVENELEIRSKKLGNLKVMKKTDKNT